MDYGRHREYPLLLLPLSPLRIDAEDATYVGVVLHASTTTRQLHDGARSPRHCGSFWCHEPYVTGVDTEYLPSDVRSWPSFARTAIRDLRSYLGKSTPKGHSVMVPTHLALL